MKNLADKKCLPCEVGGLPLESAVVETYSKNVPEWIVAKDKRKISRLFKFADFKEAMIFVNKVAALAEGEGHHPDFLIHYSQVTLELWTHEIGGLSENDFIMASKIDLIG